jgi:sugar lactone lactonase YvrE
VAGHDTLGETPLWCARTQSLLWLDIDGGLVQRFHPETGRHDVFTFDAKFAGSLALTDEAGCVLVGLDLALFIFDLSTGEQRLLCQVEPGGHGQPAERWPVRCRRPALGRNDGQPAVATEWVFLSDRSDGAIHRQFTDIIVSNTVAFSPRQDTLYFSDTRKFMTWKFPFDPERGTLGDRSIFVDHTERVIARMAPASIPRASSGPRSSRVAVSCGSPRQEKSTA